MRILINELKKLFDLKILLIIVVIAALAWLAVMRDALDSYDSLSKHGSYGSYQVEMFRLYGETLEAEELADFNFPRRYAVIATAGDAIIAREPLFAKYGIDSFTEYLELTSRAYSDEEAHLNPIERDDEAAMNNLLQGGTTESIADTIEGWYASPLMRWGCLETLETRYTDYQQDLEQRIENWSAYGNSNAYVRALERILSRENNSLINDYLMRDFSFYAAIAGVIAILAVIILVMPPLLTDRSRNVNLLQYSSVTGRRILRIQFTAALISSFVLSVVLTALLFAPFVLSAREYWNASILSSGNIWSWLYDVTFGQYVFILAGMIAVLCVCAACTAFILARYSMNIINAMIKAVPTALILSTLCVFAVNRALSDNLIIFTTVHSGRFDVPEVIVCCAVCLIVLVAVSVIAAREKRVDVI